MLKIIIFIMFFTVGHIWSELRILPDPKLTPGGVNSNITFELLTTKGWSTKFVRNVTEEEKNIVFKLYNINPKDYPPKSFEIDHLISLELGGDNSISNLWPEPYFGKVNAHTKDRLEDRLHKLVVTKQITLRQAQLEISTNWVTAFNKYFNTNLTL